MTQNNEWRKPTEAESQILKRMLEPQFLGVEQLREQVVGLLVREIDEDGCLSLKVQTNVRAETKYRIPVEANYSDGGEYQSAPHVNILLHVIDGLMNELEVYKDDNTPILRPPTVTELHIFTPSNWKND
jgi:hypothetical protein